MFQSTWYVKQFGFAKSGNSFAVIMFPVIFHCPFTLWRELAKLASCLLNMLHVSGTEGDEFMQTCAVVEESQAIYKCTCWHVKVGMAW